MWEYFRIYYVFWSIEIQIHYDAVYPYSHIILLFLYLWDILLIAVDAVWRIENTLDAGGGFFFWYIFFLLQFS